MRLKGFRPGKVPRAIVERMYKRQVEDEVARDLIESSLGQAIQENQIQPVAPPTVDKLELKSGAPFKFSARVEVRSQVVPKDYSGVELTKRKAKVSDEQVTEALENYRRRLTEYKPVEGRTETAPTDVLMVEVHGKVGEHKIKRKQLAVDLEDEAGGALPGLATRLRGCRSARAEVEVKYTLADEGIAQRSWRAAPSTCRSPSRRRARRRSPRSTTRWPRTPARPRRWTGLREKIRERLLETDEQRIKREMIAGAGQGAGQAQRLPDRARAGRAPRAGDGQPRQEPADDGGHRRRGQNFDEAKMRAGVPRRRRGRGARHDPGAGDRRARGHHRRPTPTSRSASPSWRPRARRTRRSCAPSWRRTTASTRSADQICEQKTLDMLIAQAKITDEDPAPARSSPPRRRLPKRRPRPEPDANRNGQTTMSDRQPFGHSTRRRPPRATSSSRPSSSRPTAVSAAGTSSPACSRTASSSWARRSTTRSPTSSSPSCCSSRARTRTRTSSSTSTRRAAWSRRAWRSTTPCSTCAPTWRRSAWARRRRWARSCWRRAPRASATRCRTRAS